MVEMLQKRYILFNTGLKRAAMAAIGQELAHLKKDSHLTLPGWARITRHIGESCTTMPATAC